MRYQKLYQMEQTKNKDLGYQISLLKEEINNIATERNSYRTQLDARIELMKELKSRIEWLQSTLRLAVLSPDVIKSISVNVKVPANIPDPAFRNGIGYDHFAVGNEPFWK